MEEIANPPVVFRSKVEPQKNYLRYKDHLRSDFWYSCAYCSMTEIEACGIEFEIEHYVPKATDPKLINDYDNLMWACSHCNRYKSSYYPSEKALNLGYYVIRPDEEDPRDHLGLKDCRLIEKTPTGKFNIELLDLNRKVLRRLREIRQRFHDANEYISQGVRALKSTRIDEVHPKNRFLFKDIRQKVLDRHGYLEDSMERIVEQYAKSPMVDTDDEKTDRMKNRRKFLKDVKAITH